MNRFVWVVARNITTGKLEPARFRINDPYIYGLQTFDSKELCSVMCVE